MVNINYSGDDELDKKISCWLEWDKNKITHREIHDLVQAGEWYTLRKSLLSRLSFGTAGLRGPMQAGFNAMNDLVIIQTAQGLCDYILKLYPLENDRKRGIVIGWDGRHNSKRFAELSACVFVQRNIKVWLYSVMVATPFVPFAILNKNCLAGVMVTASHNPKQDNGYKVYWDNGAQIISPHDKYIQDEILKNLEPRVDSWNLDVLKNNKLIEDPYEEVTKAYYEKLLKVLPDKFLNINKNSEQQFVYTAMHGVGYPYVNKAFEIANLKPVIPVEAQVEPDPEFPTVAFPNPEEGKSALQLSIRKALAENISVILANDPDADRLAVAEREGAASRQFKVFNGNELGALLGWWALHSYKELQPDLNLSDSYMIASTVSSKILRSMSEEEGFNFDETLTGFKWMANRAIDLQEQNKIVLFAFEEAIGFMFSTNVLDKDGVSAACHLATMACYLKQYEKLTLNEKLNEIYDKYGYHYTNNSYLFCHQPLVIQRIFQSLRNYQNGTLSTYPTSICDGEFPIKDIRDLTTGYDSSKPDGRATLPVSRSSQMITFTFENGAVITLRTSGTEPKIKYYAEICGAPENKDWEGLRNTLDRMVHVIVDEFLQPHENDLTPRND